MERRQAGEVERKQAGKVEGKTVDVCVRLGTSAWSRRGEDARTLSFARQPAAIVRPCGEVVNAAAPAQISKGN